MEIKEALDRLKAMHQCIVNYVSGRPEICDKDCDNCDLTYAKGNMGQHQEALEVAIREVERLYEHIQEIERENERQRQRELEEDE